MKVSTLNLLTLLGCAVLAGLAFWLTSHTPVRMSRAFAPLGAVPSGAAFVATLDVARLRQSKDGAALVAAGREVPGLGQIGKICGFDPTVQIQKLVVAVAAAPSEPGRREPVRVGLVATGEFEAGRLIECATRVISRRGGTPGQTRVGTFVAVRDRSSATGSEIAVREQGPVLIGEGSYLRDMVDAADAKIPTVRRDEVHMALRRTLGEDAMLLATWVAKAGWLERALGSDEFGSSPFASVRAVGLRVDLSPHLTARAVVGCASAQACAQIAAGLREQLAQVLAPFITPPLALLLTKRLTVKAVDQALEVGLRLEPREFAVLSELLTPRPERAPAPSTSAAPALEPDEVVRPEP